MTKSTTNLKAAAASPLDRRSKASLEIVSMPCFLTLHRKGVQLQGASKRKFMEKVNSLQLILYNLREHRQNGTLS